MRRCRSFSRNQTIVFRGFTTVTLASVVPAGLVRPLLLFDDVYDTGESVGPERACPIIFIEQKN